MSLFKKTEEKPEEKTSLFGGKSNEKNEQISIENESSIVRGTGGTVGTGSGGTDGTGGTNDRVTDGTSGGNSDGTAAGNGTGKFATFSFKSADSNDGESDDGNVSNDSGLESESSESNESRREDASSSDAEGKTSSRPTWLSKAEEKKEEAPKDIRIQRNSNKRKKDEGYLSEEQVKIIFSGIFDGVALIKGEHWKLEKSELEIIPALTRVMNRIVDALPKNVAKHTFNIMDYVVIISCVAAIVMKRVNHGKEDKKNAAVQSLENSREATGRNTANLVPIGNKGSSGTNVEETAGIGGEKQGISNGFTSVAPIKDLAASISSIR